MSKQDNIGPIRIEKKDKAILERACKKTGVSLAAKLRELGLEWARKVLT